MIDLAATRELIVQLEDAMNQFRHCQRQGPWWFTNGEPALRAQTDRWLGKADEAIAALRATLVPNDMQTPGSDAAIAFGDGSGWIWWEGGTCPVEDGQSVSFIRRDGETIIGADHPEEFNWGRYDREMPTDIVWYRHS